MLIGLEINEKYCTYLLGIETCLVWQNINLKVVNVKYIYDVSNCYGLVVGMCCCHGRNLGSKYI